MDRDYQKIKAEYIAGGTSYRQLAEKYGVPFSTLRKVAAKEQWTELRNKTRAKTDTKISDAISEKQAAKTEKIIDVADKLLDKIAEVIDLVTDTQGIKHLTSAIKDIKDIKGIKSDIDIREQEARISNLQKQAAKTEESHDITVTIGSDAEEYSG